MSKIEKITKFNIEKLRELYITYKGVAGLTKYFNCSYDTVRTAYMKKGLDLQQLYNIARQDSQFEFGTRKNQSLKSITKQQLKDLLEQLKTMETVAKHLKVSHYVLKQKFNELNIKVRTGPKITFPKSPSSEVCQKISKGVSKALQGHTTSVETRKKMSKTRKHLYQENKIKKWNLGRTKVDHPSIAKGAKNTSEKRRQLYAQGKLNLTHSKHEFRKDLNLYCDSTWDANMCRILNYHKIPFGYNVKQFPLEFPNGRLTTYHPDFEISPTKYIEVKGHAKSNKGWNCACKRCINSREKHQLLQEQYPSVRVILIGQAEYLKLKSKYKPLISNWEFDSI